ncbi:hypothetical protein ZIOFF_013326 [Zingiber officinale]|uniref:Uncharacterized protein n=2 Tax=Magnoliopsida TaxID=3398 RepID=A0A8J5LCM9_ZINOF|nr:hypothetical protein ZIOFF_013326 [Zingiber officinale]
MQESRTASSSRRCLLRRIVQRIPVLAPRRTYGAANDTSSRMWREARAGPACRRPAIATPTYSRFPSTRGPDRSTRRAGPERPALSLPPALNTVESKAASKNTLSEVVSVGDRRFSTTVFWFPIKLCSFIRLSSVGCEEDGISAAVLVEDAFDFDKSLLFCLINNMVRKRRTDASGSGESSEYQETSGSAERAGPQRGPAPQQQGGARERGWVASGSQQAQQGGRGGGGYYQGRGSHPQPRDPEQPFAPSYQGRGGHQFRGGMPYQQQYGGRRGGRSAAGGRGFGPSAAGSTRPPVPELHQATQAPYQPTQPGPLQASSSRQSEMPTSEVVEQFQQLSVEGESSSQEMQPIVPPASSSKSVRFPVRPGKGTNGARCVVKANHFFAELPDKDLHQYDVSITPEVTSRGVNRAVMEQLVRLYRESYLGGRLPAYDGRKSLYTAGPLPFTLKDFQIILVDDDDGSGTERRQRTFRVVIKLAARVDLHHLGMFLAGRQADAPQEALQVLDIVLRELPTARYLPVGRSFYSPDLGRRQHLGEGLESWRGFYQSIRPTQMGLSLNIGNDSTYAFPRLLGTIVLQCNVQLSVLGTILEFVTEASVEAQIMISTGSYLSCSNEHQLVQTLYDLLLFICIFNSVDLPYFPSLLCDADMSSTAFIEPLPVIEFVIELLNRDVQSRPLSDADRVKIKKALRGVKVEVTHRGNMRRKYRISGLTSQATRELTFPVDERGTVKSVVQYFQETYGFTIQHTSWPCLQVGNQQRPNYLPMEVSICHKSATCDRHAKCLLVFLSVAFDINLLSWSCGVLCNKFACELVFCSDAIVALLVKVLEVFVVAPELLYQLCLKLREAYAYLVVSEAYPYLTVHHNAYHEDPFAREFGIKISEKLASVEARVLPPPWLKYHDTGREKNCLPRVGQWNMMNKKMVNGGRVNSWTCINFAKNVQDNLARGFCHELAQMCQISGMEFSLDPVLHPLTARPDHVERALKARYHDAMSILQPQGKELDLLIVILPDNNGSLYGDLKRICETDLGLVSQCCLTKHVFRMSKQYLANVALKINVKVGGRNTVLVDALSRCIPLVSDRPTIIFGADVTHPHPGEDSSPSIAAVVASQDWPEVTKYAGLVCAQAHRQELIQDLFKVWQDPQRGTLTGGMIKELLISFKKATGQKPQRIIFYRDGVSEGQFYQVLLYELDAIRKACASLEPNYQPPVTFVVVQKRHHTRLFANNHGDHQSVDKSGNILPGTVVDSKICHPTEFDFYLCSHAGIQGTSRPAHYHVLWDENKFTADGLQTLTNNLCYTYARCTRSVSIVPPAYYAHLAAFRARFYMEPETSDSGSLASGAAAGRGFPPGGARATRGPGTAAVKPLPALKENVKRVMFYC